MIHGRKRRIVFLCSGDGGNLRFIYKAIEQGWIAFSEIAAVLTDRDCSANRFAALMGLFSETISFDERGQVIVLERLNALEPDLVISTVHKILRQPIVDGFQGRIVNLHYSLLPAFCGLIGTRPIQAALDFGAKFTGVTSHLVDESVDGGRPIMQIAIPLNPGDQNSNKLINLVFRCGCLALMTSINIQLNNHPSYPFKIFTIMGRECIASASISNFSKLLGQELWDEVSLLPISD